MATLDSKERLEDHLTFMPMMSFLAVLTCPISCGSSSFLIFSSPSACPALLMFLRLDCPSNSMVGRAIWIHQPEECFLSSHCQEADYSLFKEERREVSESSNTLLSASFSGPKSLWFGRRGFEHFLSPFAFLPYQSRFATKL